MRAAVTDLLVALVAIVCIVWGLGHLTGATRDLVVEPLTVGGSTPITVYRDPAAQPGPAVVIAHGFAGSQQLMQPFAITLARAGYVAITFDFEGHGRHPEPLRGSVTDETGATAALLRQLTDVAAVAREGAGADGRLALLGHSMASDIIVRYGQTHDDVAAVVAVSMFAPTVTATSPNNLLMIVGAWERGLTAEALRVASLATDGPAEAHVTYGDIAAGTGRRVVLADHVEHVGVLYSADSLDAARDWLDRVFDREVEAMADRRGPAIGLLFLGLVLLARPLAHRLPVAAAPPLGAGLAWRRLWWPAVVPMIGTPLILSFVPVSFLPIVVGDYLVMHFALYGLLTAAVLALVRRGDADRGRLLAQTRWRPVCAGAFLLAAYSILVFGLPIDLYVTSFFPTADRWPLVLPMLAGTLCYFVADEWLTRGARVPRGTYAFTKLCFLLSLAIAVALDFERLFFLIIIVPVILVFFVIYGLFSGWAYRRTGHPLTGGLANAAAFAWAIAVTFPLVTG